MIGQGGLALIKEYEGLRLEAYQCAAGVWTIGYGHTGPDVHPGMVITEARAEELLRDDLIKVAAKVLMLTEDLSLAEHQTDALKSLCYNIGLGAFERSTLLLCIKANPAGANVRYEWLRWTHARGRHLPSLRRRREAELRMYFGEE